MYHKEKSQVYFNGSFVKATDVKTDLYTQTLHYGNGVFEGIRSYDTSDGVRIFKAKEHFERLKYSAENSWILEAFLNKRSILFSMTAPFF